MSIENGIILPITENGKKDFYITDAPYKVITDCFLMTDGIEEFIEEMESRDYRVKPYKASLSLDFDKK